MNSTPLRAFFGHHKCGTSWISRVIGDVCAIAGLKIAHRHYENLFDGDIVGLKLSSPFDFWRYTNADINFTRSVDLLGFHVVRDPRDVIVSAYFSHLNSHPDDNWPRLRHYRPYLRSLSKEAGIKAEMEFSGIFLLHMLSWDYCRPNVLELRFEDLIRDEFNQFERIFRFLKIVPDSLCSADLARVVQQNTFQVLSGGRSPGEQDIQSHYRRGSPGDWREHFDGAHIDYFKKLYNPLLLKLGYESKEDW
jgi:hypothetical protein